jgi:hypothetical protein
MTKEELLDMHGEFTYLWGCDFHVKTEKGCFHWSSIDYPNGKDTMRPCGSYDELRQSIGVGFGRRKGTHLIRDYCGITFTIVENHESL